jgi:hypothetical protein
MRDSYKVETEWAPPHVGRQLRGVRLVAENARKQAIRSAAEARTAADPETAGRHANMADSARALQQICRRIEASLAEAMDDRLAWEQITAGPRRLAVAADFELRRRNPDKPIEPLRSAEPRVPENDELTKLPDAAKPAEPPEWVTPARRAAPRLPGKARGTAERHGPRRGSRLRVPRHGMALAGTRPRRHPAATQARATALRRNRTARRPRDARPGGRGLATGTDERKRHGL